MRWTERQQAMLRAMGVSIWQPAGDADDADAAEGLTPADTAASLQSLPVEPPARRPAGPPAPPPVAAPSVASEACLPVRAAAATVPADGVARMDWPALRDAVAGCHACALCESRRQTVFGVGHEQARWMLVGEAPGEQEDRQGEPFVGPAGQLLDRMLLALGLTRGEADADRQVYIANTLKCRPPRNRNPEPDELSKCLPFLERQLALVQPRVILAMGRFAVQALLGSDDPIGKLRGRVHRWQGVPVVVTYHPAYLLRQPTEKARVWADLCLAAEAFDAAAAAASG